MHIKHQKTEEVGRCLASLWLKQTVNNVSFRLLGVVVCCEAVLAQGARPSQPDHVHEPPPKSTGEEKLLNWCIVPELDPGGDELSRSEASASIWACRRSWSAILFPSGVSPQLLINIVEGKRMENQEVGGLSNMTEVVFVFNRGGEGVLQGWGGWGVERKMGGGWTGSLVLMSRRRSSGPPWSVPRPPGPGRPWSWCPGTRAWRRHSSGRPSWPPKSSGSGSEEKRNHLRYGEEMMSYCPLILRKALWEGDMSVSLELAACLSSKSGWNTHRWHCMFMFGSIITETPEGHTS